ncbi:nucleotide/nucleic acid binding protein [Wolffia australiana]
MSRLCVKNLPKYVGEERLREFFSQRGEVTDAKLMRTKDGKSRRFAFIGFHSEADAEEAIKFFNNTFLDTCKITCEVAHKVGDPNIPRPWSQYSAKKNDQPIINAAKTENQKTTTVVESKSSLSNDPQLQEFLQIMQPRAKSKFWANDTVGSNLFDEGKNQSEKPKTNVGKDSESSDASSVEDDDGISDMDYLKSRIKKNWSDSEDEEDETEIKENKEMAKETENDVLKSEDPARGQDFDNDEAPCNTGRLFIRNLPYTTIEDDLMELFSKYGEISQVHIVLDKDTKRSKGFAYVHFAKMEMAARALEDLDNSIFQGRLLHIMHAKPQNLPSNRQESELPQSLKKKREEQKKASEASGETRAWNSLFIRQDTVVENIARKYGVDKSDILDREADDVAVRIALAETHAIAETKKALKSAGINVSALEEFASVNGNVRRSNHIILVKNLPYSSSEEDLARMFGSFGSLDKVVLPPTKTLALVIFLEAADARAAFKGLAYKRYKDGPLYLEWAPGDILSPTNVSETVKVQLDAVGKEEVQRAVLKQSLEQMPESEIDPERVESRSVFVKNLNFRTSDEDLKKHFESNLKRGSVQSAKVKKHMKNGKSLSMGYGFIELDSLETATEVVSQLQGTVLDGHALILQLCHAKKGDQTRKTDEKDKSSTKLIVRNVAFEATEKELKQLFSSFGQVRRLRLPKRIDNHRGFAFVEYVTKQETDNALRALSSTHLYGRRLVIERAKEGETLEELRERTAAQSTVGSAIQKTTKKRRRNEGEEE